MSRIDVLIQELCPDGVERKPLAEMGALVRGNGMPRSDFAAAGVGCIHYGQIYMHYGTWATETISYVPADKAEKLAKVDPGDLIITNTSENADDVCKAMAWLGDTQIVTGGHATVLKHNQNPKFLAYWFQSPDFKAQRKRHITGTKVLDVSAGKLAKIEVPLPPLEVQHQIADILDTYSQLEARLEAELTAELEARRRQYAHYRRLAFDFDTASRCANWVTLPDIAKNLDGQRRPITRSARVPGPYPYYGASGIVDNVDGYILDGDFLLVSEDGANLVARSSPIAFSAIGKFWVNNHAHVLQFPSYVERRFVEIYLNSLDISEWVSGGPQPKLNKANLNRIPIPRPPLPEQERIVAVLDSFDALVTDLSSVLPSEITARRKQYEHYRNLLLTFDELSA